MPSRTSERVAAFCAGVLFFLVLGSYFVLKPVREALAIDDDPLKIWHLFLGTFVVMLAIAPLWGAIVARWPRRTFVPLAYHAFVAQLVILYLLDRGGVAPYWLPKVFFVWVSVFNLFVVSVFWSLCNDLFTKDQARRWFPPIAAGGTVGAITGPMVTGALVEHIGVDGVFLVAAGMLEVAAFVALLLDRIAPRVDRRGDDEPVGGGVLAGLRDVAASPYLRTIGLYVLLASFAATFLYIQQGEIAREGFATREERTAFFADLDLWTNVGVFLVQTLIASRLLGLLGVGVVLCALPLVQGVALWGLAAAPTVAVLSTFQVAGRTAQHALSRPARETLFSVRSREDKWKGKNVIDTLVFRFGDVASAYLYAVIAGFGSPTILAIATPLMLLWIAVSLWLGRAYKTHP